MSAKQENLLLADRQAQILVTVIREYINSANPVGSHTLVEKYHLPVSSATVRNDMAYLEDEGYLASPHTSAGRIPTEHAYRYYVEHCLEVVPLAGKEQKELRSAWQVSQAPHSAEQNQSSLKELARALAAFSAESVFVADSRSSAYCTGLANLFLQPEFREADHLSHLGSVIDHLDDYVARMYDEVPEDVVVMVGSENPFSDSCSIIASRRTLADGTTSLLGILGPLRMDYDANVSRMRFVSEHLWQLL